MIEVTAISVPQMRRLRKMAAITNATGFRNGGD